MLILFRIVLSYRVRNYENRLEISNDTHSFKHPAEHVYTFSDLVQAKAEVLVVKGEDVAETISNVVSMYEIHKLVVGDSSQGNFIRYLTCSVINNGELHASKC